MMRIRLAFLVSLGIASLPGFVAGVWVCARQWHVWTQAVEAEQATHVVAAVQRAQTALVIEVGKSTAALLGSASDIEQLAAARASADRLFGRALEAASGSGFDPGPLREAAAAFKDFRRKVDPVMASPPAELSHTLVQEGLDLRTVHGARLSKLASAAALKVNSASWLSTGFVRIAVQVMDLRDYLGQRNLILNSWVGGQPVSPEGLVLVDQLTGRVQLAWLNLTRSIEVMPPVPQLLEEERRQTQAYLHGDEVRWLAVSRIAHERASSPPGTLEATWPDSLSAFRAWSQEALASVVRLRDVALDEAVSQANLSRRAALLEMTGAAALVVTSLCLSAAVAATLLRRFVLPVRRMTMAVDRIAVGDLETRVAGFTRRDELGTMATAIEKLRKSAVDHARLSAAEQELSAERARRAERIRELVELF